jgi:hypothetical protein
MGESFDQKFLRIKNPIARSDLSLAAYSTMVKLAGIFLINNAF